MWQTRFSRALKLANISGDSSETINDSGVINAVFFCDNPAESVVFYCWITQFARFEKDYFSEENKKI